LGYCTIKSIVYYRLRGAYGHVLVPGFENLTLDTLLGMNRKYMSRAIKALVRPFMTKVQVRNYLQG